MTHTSSLSHRITHLSIEAGEHFASVLGADRSRRECGAVEVFSVPEHERAKLFPYLLRHSVLTGENPVSVAFSVAHTRCTLIPLALFDKAGASEYLALNVALTAADEIRHQAVHSLQAVVVFALDQSLRQAVEQRFPSASFSHCAALFLEQAAQWENAQATLHLCFYPGFFQIAVLQNRKLLFFNAFPWRSAEDVVYYTLYTAEQLRLSQENELVLYGETATGDAASKSLKRFFPHLRYATRKSDLAYSSDWASIAPQRFLNLIHQFRCAL